MKERGYQRFRWVDVFAGKVTSSFAPFHVIWSIPTMVWTVFGQSTFVFGTRDTLVHTPEAMQAIQICDMAWLSPSMLDDVAKSEEWLKSLTRLDHIVYTGGKSLV